MRIRSHKSLRSHAPFAGTGASLYENGLFRRLRFISPRRLCGPESTCGGTNVNKTMRVDHVTSPTHQFPVDSVALASSTVPFQVRIFKDNLENESDFRPLTITFDGGGDDATGILGSLTYLSQQQLAGGIVRIYFRYAASRSGIQPVTFQAIRTAGPSSPAAGTTRFVIRKEFYSIDTPALSDASPYTYKIRAVNGATTADLATGISVTADATGPSAPTSGSVEVV